MDLKFLAFFLVLGATVYAVPLPDVLEEQRYDEDESEGLAEATEEDGIQLDEVMEDRRARRQYKQYFSNGKFCICKKMKMRPSNGTQTQNEDSTYGFEEIVDTFNNLNENDDIDDREIPDTINDDKNFDNADVIAESEVADSDDVSESDEIISSDEEADVQELDDNIAEHQSTSDPPRREARRMNLLMKSIEKYITRFFVKEYHMCLCTKNKLVIRLVKYLHNIYKVTRRQSRIFYWRLRKLLRLVKLQRLKNKGDAPIRNKENS